MFCDSEQKEVSRGILFGATPTAGHPGKFFSLGYIWDRACKVQHGSVTRQLVCELPMEKVLRRLERVEVIEIGVRKETKKFLQNKFQEVF